MQPLGQSRASERADLRHAALAVLALALFWLLPWLFVPPQRAWGWDESMHAELPALRMLVSAQGGEWRAAFAVLHDCNQYPFGWPLVLALVQAVTGVSELACRVAGTLAWCATLLGLFMLVQELVRAQRGPEGEPRRGDSFAPWLALGFGALSPLGLAYAGTLFLEVPFALVATFALRAWLRRGAQRGDDGAWRRELAAGAWLAAAFFVKFNYGLLLGFGLVLAWVLELVAAARGGALRAFLVRGCWLAAPPVIAFSWWFLLPLPEGPEVAARHREALMGFLGGNLAGAPTPWGVRGLHWIGYFAPGAIFLAALLAGALRTLGECRRPGARALWLALLGAGLPVWLHPFHLDRFLLPGGPALWALGALGLARLAPATARLRRTVLTGLGALAFVVAGADVRWLATRSGLLKGDAERRAFVEETLADWRRLDAGRSLPTAGLARAERDELLGLVSAAARPDERIGWLGLSSELAPAAIHIALLEAGGSPSRFLRDSHRPMDVTFEGLDPGWDSARFVKYAANFDVIFTTDPPDLRARGNREFIRGYQGRLLAELGWESKELGTVELDRPLQEPLVVRIFACRPTP